MVSETGDKSVAAITQAVKHGEVFGLKVLAENICRGKSELHNVSSL
ncbi:MAG: hypothetical protein ACLUI0_11920 [Blautia massiliensis (ex Durand et al. 2017)]